MSQFNSPAYDVERPTGTCIFTGRKLLPGEPYMAALIETPSSSQVAVEGDKAATSKKDDKPAKAEKSEKIDKTEKPDKVEKPEKAEKAAKSGATGLGFKRVDISMEAWQKGQRPEHVFSHWKSTVPHPNQKRKMFVDDEVLLSLFRRLQDTEQAERLAFRFVLSLILLRKKLLKYDGSVEKQVTVNGAQVVQEWWMMIPKGDAEPLLVLNPRLDDGQIRQVTEQLSEVLESDL